ncbi:hypothetical protein WICPIJ_002732 [Wickerhamomyces pijperi]|uniref:Uncharacterized protein n=1 Tax=Wickerhamomyces pijperi TaxID=599730 RepID=A0A9P8TNN2_WICPI|nr:hypothetical protein WICPIJ_002732 [Wickerhamomyces pijperi]
MIGEKDADSCDTRCASTPWTPSSEVTLSDGMLGLLLTFESERTREKFVPTGEITSAGGCSCCCWSEGYSKSSNRNSPLPIVLMFVFLTGSKLIPLTFDFVAFESAVVIERWSKFSTSGSSLFGVEVSSWIGDSRYLSSSTGTDAGSIGENLSLALSFSAVTL